MSYHQIIITSREERPISDDAIHELVWHIYERCRIHASGYPTVRVLDVKGNVVNEANRRLADSDMRRTPPSCRTDRFAPGTDMPEDDMPVDPIQEISDYLDMQGYPSDLFRFGVGVIHIAGGDNPEWSADLHENWVRCLPAYDSLPMQSDYGQHDTECDCGECYSHDDIRFRVTAIKALMTLACSRDGWQINVDNINRDWYEDLAAIHYRMTGERL